MTSSVVPMPSPQGEGVALRRSHPTAALPSILGMYAFAAATFIVAAHMAHWYGNVQSAIVLFPLVLILGGLAQFLCRSPGVSDERCSGFGHAWHMGFVLDRVRDPGNLVRHR